MSHQGNIKVRWTNHRGELKSILFTTCRFSGASTPELVQKVLESVVGLDRPWDDLTRALSHAACIDRPIVDIGNEDVPTVTVDFNKRSVYWIWEVHPCLRGIGTWTFSEYTSPEFFNDARIKDLMEQHFNQ